MTHEKPRKDDEGSEARGLNSTEYRHRLLNKLNCLIAVLEVAIGKIDKSMEAEDANRDRLQRIKTNLENTLAICRRAKSTLETKLLEDPSTTASEPMSNKKKKDNQPQPSKDKLSFRCYVELSSIDEFRKFKELPAITQEDVADTDMDELTRRLLESD